MATEFTYNITDTLNNKLNPRGLHNEIVADSTITIQLASINSTSTTFTAVFQTDLTASMETQLTALVATHAGEELPRISTVSLVSSDGSALPTDTDGAPLSRNKITRTGWHFQGQAVEVTSSTLNGFYNKDKAGNDLGYCVVKGYDSNGVELITQAALNTSCVKTVITWEMTQDIEMIGGDFYQGSVPTNDFRVWVTAIPDLPAPSGNIPFLQGGINTKHMGTGKIFAIDGRTPKHLPYNYGGYPTNKFEICIKHTAGVKHNIMFVPELFREPS